MRFVTSQRRAVYRRGFFWQTIGAQLDNPDPPDTGARTSAGQIDPLRDEKRRNDDPEIR
jgi:hypothetical protein